MYFVGADMSSPPSSPVTVVSPPTSPSLAEHDISDEDVSPKSTPVKKRKRHEKNAEQVFL